MNFKIVSYYKEYRKAGWNSYDALRNAKIKEKFNKYSDFVRLQIVPDNDEGVRGIIGEVYNNGEWYHVDSVFGFVGEDWKNFGYDFDIMEKCVKYYEALGDFSI